MNQSLRAAFVGSSLALACVSPVSKSGSRSPAVPAAAGSPLDSVRVEGQLVHTRLAGTSGPSVVLISGLGDGMRPWSDVQAAVAQFARVLSYDRLGLGQSDAGRSPRTVSRMTGELHALLAQSGLPKPYVLVGHSLGGFIAQMYASKYPDEVSGMVLVDPSIVGFYVSANALPEFRQATEDQHKRMASAPPGIRAELEAFSEDVTEMQNAAPIPAIPIVLLTSIHHGPPSATLSPLDSIWLAEHRHWASEHPGTRQVVDTVHGHYLQRETPDAVVDAIRSLTSSAGHH